MLHAFSRRYVAFTFEGIYVKHMCESVPMTSWGRVYYTNAMSSVPLLVIALFLNEQQTILNLHWGFEVCMCVCPPVIVRVY